MTRSLYSLFFTLLSVYSFAQHGIIKGSVTDVKTGESLPGVSVFIEGTTMGANTDMDGRFMITKVPVGMYTLLCKFMSYTTKQINNVVVKEGEVTAINSSLEESKTNLQEVVIEAEPTRETLTALLIAQKNNASVSDGISAEIIKRTPDRTSSDVLKRISGTTIQDNKFAIIRGLNDRYNAAFINGAPLPSSESDRKAFSFDIFPSTLLDNITIIKSATPDLPAEFAGGIIQVNTKSIPEKNTQSLSIGGGYNALTTTKNLLTYKGGKTDWLGIDDGTRALSSAIPITDTMLTYTNKQKADLAKATPNDWALQQRKALPNFNLQYSLGHTFNVLGNELGIVAALTYSNSNKYQETVRREFIESGLAKPQNEFELNDKEYANQILVGGLANIAYKVGKNNKISFKNLYNINSEDKVVTRYGIRDPETSNPIIEKSDLRWFTSNKLISSQLTGEHYIEKQKIKIKWIGGYSNIIRDIPNMRRMVYTKSGAATASPLAPFTASIGEASTSPSYGGNMFYSTNNENVYSGNLDVSKQFTIGKVKSELKIGAYYQERNRTFAARNFGYSKYSAGNKIKFNNKLLQLSEDSIFMAQNLGEISPYIKGNSTTPSTKGVGGFKLEEGTKLNDSYTASSDIKAAYLMFDNKIAEKFRIVWGARVENFHQNLFSREDNGDTITIDTTYIDVLPSANFIYSLNDKMNVRASYAQTLNRPEYRELAPFSFYDFVTFYVVSGNPNLKRALIHNADLRYEWFPIMGQLLSASVFYKKFYNAIEAVNRPDVTREIIYQNVPSVTNYGMELEARINIGMLLQKDDKILKALSVYGNTALIKSNVDVSTVVGAIQEDRPLQGQSPYIINAGAQYTSPNSKLMLSAGINKVGRRIAIVGNTGEPNIWENPRTVLDIQAGYTFFKKLDLKINVKDVLAQKLIFYQDLNNNKKYDKDADNTMTMSNFGSTFSVSLGYRFY